MQIFFNRHITQDTYTNPVPGSLLDDIAKTRNALESAYAGFDYAVDPDLIDCYIYEINSLLKRYKFLLDEAAAYTTKKEDENKKDAEKY